MNWFRFYHDVMDNPKLMRLPAESFRFWVILLCLASRSAVRGSLPDVEEIGFRTRTDLDQVRAHIDLFVARRLIEVTPSGGLIVSKWDEFQQKSDDSSPRKRRQRAGKKSAQSISSPKINDVTGHVTGQSRFRVEERRGDEIRGAVDTAPIRAAENGEPIPVYPEVEMTTLDLHSGAHDGGTPWARSFWVKLWVAFGDIRVNNGWWEHQRWYSPELWDAALRQTMQTGKKPNSAKYLEAIASRFEVDGIPADPGKPTVAARPAPISFANQIRQNQIDEARAYAVKMAEKRKQEARNGDG